MHVNRVRPRPEGLNPVPRALERRSSPRVRQSQTDLVLMFVSILKRGGGRLNNLYLSWAAGFGAVVMGAGDGSVDEQDAGNGDVYKGWVGCRWWQVLMLTNNHGRLKITRSAFTRDQKAQCLNGQTNSPLHSFTSQPLQLTRMICKDWIEAQGFQTRHGANYFSSLKNIRDANPEDYFLARDISIESRTNLTREWQRWIHLFKSSGVQCLVDLSLSFHNNSKHINLTSAADNAIQRLLVKSRSLQLLATSVEQLQGSDRQLTLLLNQNSNKHGKTTLRLFVLNAFCMVAFFFVSSPRLLLTLVCLY